MATLPRVGNSLAAAGAAGVAGEDLLVVISPCATNADATPRILGSAAAVYAQHGYCEGVEYVARHVDETALSVAFVGIPIATPGVVGRDNTSGNAGTSVTSITAGSSGVLHEHDGVLTCEVGGTVGTDQIILGLSLDGGKSTKKIRLGTATSYVVPYFGITIGATVGTLTAGQTLHTWHGTGPRGDSTGWAAAFTALADETWIPRSLINLGDMQTDTEVSAMVTLLGAYETTAGKIATMRMSVLDRLPLASLSSTSHRMSTANVTFAEVGATGDTITRASGSWITDGFATGDILTISGSASNDATLAAAATVTSATVVTLDTDDLVAEGPVANVTITGEASLTFSDAADTIVRSSGSWLADGFRIGDVVTIADSVSNNGAFTVTDVTAATLTLEANDLANEVIGATAITVTAGQTEAAWIAAISSEFASIDDDEHVDLSCGKARKFSSFSQWHLRTPAAWDASCREYQHDMHIDVWRVSDGPTGASLTDADDVRVEYDDRVGGGAASAARFTSYRTWNNRNGVFLANSLTRALDASLLVQTHNTMVVNRARNVCNSATQFKVGAVLAKSADGTLTSAARKEVESFVNTSLAKDLLANKRDEGPRCSNVQWAMASDDDFSVPEPVTTGVLTVDLNGTIHSILTTTRVR